MIKANELRIGNYVKSKSSNSILLIESISRRFITGFDEINLKEQHGFDWIEPIPLTEEWLIKFGFDITYSSNFRLKFDHPNSIIGYDFSHTTDKLMEGFRYYGQYIKIKYVHQLQNLYFALTGEELVCAE